VAFPESASDVQAIVEFARRRKLGIAPQGTGHGALSLGSLEDTILLNTACAMRTTDWGAAPVFPVGGATSGEREIPWVDPARFFAGLSEVMAEVPARPGEEAWYRWLESLLQAAADGRWRSC
jgi:hypothetical protein